MTRAKVIRIRQEKAEEERAEKFESFEKRIIALENAVADLIKPSSAPAAREEEAQPAKAPSPAPSKRKSEKEGGA